MRTQDQILPVRGLVDPGGRVRVDKLDRNGAFVEVERGCVVAKVEYSEDSRWRFEVGPYDVVVTGTRFEASWSPVQESFDITMQEGSVRVRGPLLSSEHLVVAGQRLSLRPEPTERPTSNESPRPEPAEEAVAVQFGLQK